MFENIIKIFKKENKSTDISTEIDNLFDSLEEDIVRFEVGTDLIPHIDLLCSTTKQKRRNIKNATGFILPSVRFKSNARLQENSYIVFINEKIIEEKYVIPTEENIEEEVTNSINNLYENYLSEIFSNSTLERYIGKVKEQNPKLIADLSNWLATTEIKYILIDLLQNKKSIKNISYIFEKISEQLFVEKSYNNDDIKNLSKAITNLFY